MTSPPVCAPPDPSPRRPRNAVPDGACDCHFHAFDGPSELVPERCYTPSDARMADYLAMRKTLGLARGVIVQSSTHGTDNRTLFEVMPSDDTMRAIVVVDDDCPVSDLRAFADQGAVGCRGNMLFSSSARLDDLAGLARRIADVGWHLQLLVDASLTEGLESLIRESPVPVVLDHMGHVPVPRGVDDPAFQSMLRLLDTGNLWVKLSGAYRIAPLDMSAAAPMAQALIAANPDRLVWGTDWPHPAIRGPMPNDGDLMDQLFDWADAETAKKILVRNPERLYGFAPWEGRDAA